MSVKLGDTVHYTDHRGEEHAALVTGINGDTVSLAIFWNPSEQVLERVLNGAIGVSAAARRGKPEEANTWHPRGEWHP